MMNLRCPACRRWLLEIQESKFVRMRVRCCSCKRMFACQWGGQGVDDGRVIERIGRQNMPELELLTATCACITTQRHCR